MTSATVETGIEPQILTPYSSSTAHLDKPQFNQNYRDLVSNKKEKLTEEIIAYKLEKTEELTWAKRLNRWSIGIALVLTAATTICGSSQNENVKGLVTPLGTLAVTLNGWIASVPMSKRVSLYERILVKADNLRSDLEFEADNEAQVEYIRENFKSLKVEFIQENPEEKLKLRSEKSETKV